MTLLSVVPSSMLTALEPGPFVTLQDMGRPGWKRFGVSGAGAMDASGLVAANALVGNPPGTAALEFGYSGGTWRVDAASVRVATGGGSFRLSADHAPLSPWSSVTLRRGQILRLDGAPDAVWGYLAVAGGFAVAPAFGSLSCHKRSGIGGTGYAPGDQLPLVAAHAPDGPERTFATPPQSPGRTVRIILGPQDDRFTPQALHTLVTADYTVTMRCDRLGYRLAGPDLPHRPDCGDIISDGVVPGSIQVPGDGQPIVLMADCQPPGGYPKIATVISSNLAAIAQSRPGTRLRFQLTSLAEAQLLRRRYLAGLEALAASTQHTSASADRTFADPKPDGVVDRYPDTTRLLR